MKNILNGCTKWLFLGVFIGILFAALGCEEETEKIGVLFIGGGMDEDYKADWKFGYLPTYYPNVPYGFYAGGPLEEGACYSIIHYASEAEAAICGVAEGTPIDVFCQEYTNTDEYPVHSVEDYAVKFGNMGGDGSFNDDCSEVFYMPFIFGAGHSTVDPVTQKVIKGPIVDDPNGPGIGLADMQEMSAFGRMTDHYQYFKDYKEPYREYFLRWIYGNDIPARYGYEPAAPEATNVKDALAAALPDSDLVFRHGWEAYMDNQDPYGNPKTIPDSTETAIRELIEDEKVDRIVAVSVMAHGANVLMFGECWRDENGEGVSILPDKTYKECVTDLTDGVGPDDPATLDTLVANKPWENYRAPFPHIVHLAEKVDPKMKITFAHELGVYDAFGESLTELLKHTVEKFSIPSQSSLKVIIATHGFSDGYLAGGACDYYPLASDTVAAMTMEKVDAYLASSWGGNYQVAHGENEFSQPNASGADDLASPDKPFGEVMGTGEHIDMAIHGTYVNELGKLTENTDDWFEYIVVLPLTWPNENADTIIGFRHETLGNHQYGDVALEQHWIRQEYDADGSQFDATDYDDEYYTIRVMDGTGWPSTPEGGKTAVYKGSATDPTTVILAGTVMSIADGPARSLITDAMVSSLIEAVSNPDLNGYLDTECVNSP